MLRAMLRFVGVVVVALSLASLASAQDVPPSYASAAPSVEVVLEPLVTAAEGDLGRGDAALAQARANLVLGLVPTSSPLHVRAEGLVLLATQRLAGAAIAETPADVLLTPLVESATSDAAGGRADLARARLDFVAAHVAATSGLALRVAAVRASLDAHASVPQPPTTTTAAPPITATTTATTTTTAPTIVVVPAQGYTTTQPGWGTQPQPPPAPPADPRRRGDGEMVELYITSGVFGGVVGAWIPYGSGLLTSRSPSEDAARGLSVATLLGTGVFMLGAFGLDQVEGGMRTGQPGSIAMGMRFGLGIGALTLGILGADTSLSTQVAFNVVGLAGVTGALLGVVGAYGLNPHPSQVQFTQTATLWGAILGAELAAFAVPLAYPSGSSSFTRGQDAQRAGFGITLGGMSLGLLTGLALSAAHVNVSARRSWLMTLGVILGTAAGSSLWALISAASQGFDVPTWGSCAGLGSIAGLVLVGFLTSEDSAPRSWDDVPVQVQASFAPMQDGGAVMINGQF
jgi:hypothetical protein